MKKFLGIVALSLLSCGNAYSIAQDGKGELKLSKNVITHFQNYLRGGVGYGAKTTHNKPSVFWVTEDGMNAYFWYCPYNTCRGGSPAQEKLICEQAYGKVCWRFARKNSVRWKNGINPAKGQMSKFNSKWSDEAILAKLTELGFYGDTSSSSITSTPKVTKKKKETKKITEVEKGDIVSQIKDLKELLDVGAITQDEFEKAKKKLLD
jgi:hypothetical protein